MRRKKQIFVITFQSSMHSLMRAYAGFTLHPIFDTQHPISNKKICFMVTPSTHMEISSNELLHFNLLSFTTACLKGEDGNLLKQREGGILMKLLYCSPVKLRHHQWIRWRRKHFRKMADKSRRVAQTEDLSNVEFETSEDVEVIPTFDNMGLRDELLRGIYAYGTIFHSISIYINL